VADKSAGQVAYEAYFEQVGGFSVNAEALPAWHDQREHLRNAWEAAAAAVLRARRPR
jgi:hypothetical protein